MWVAYSSSKWPVWGEVAGIRRQLNVQPMSPPTLGPTDVRVFQSSVFLTLDVLTLRFADCKESGTGYYGRFCGDPQNSGSGYQGS